MPVAVSAKIKPQRATRERIDVRLGPDQKSSIERAAQLKGLTVTDFIVQKAVADASRIIREHETWTLERSDADLFLNALLHPPTPAPRLRAAAKRYRERSPQT